MNKDPKDLKIITGVGICILIVFPGASLLALLYNSAYGYDPEGVIIDHFIPEFHCSDFKLGDTLDQFNHCFDYFLEEGELSPAYPPKKMYQPYTIEKLPDSIMSYEWFSPEQ